MKKIATVAALCAVLPVLAGAAPESAAEFHPPTAKTIAEAKAQLRALRFDDAAAPSAGTVAYFEAYGLAPAGATHVFGTFASRGRQLAAHVFTPPAPRATVILVHGYYDHAGIWRHVIAHLLAQGYAVAVYELPGHGLSEGARASIDDFADYVASLRDFVTLCRPHLPGPFHLVAHSLGAGIAADYLLTEPDARVDGAVVLLAPLIRPAHAALARFGQALADPFGDSIPRTFRNNSSDAAFLRFAREDPLQDRRVPFAFCKAMRAWGATMPARKPSPRPLLVVQGTRDTTVDWRFNTALLKEKFPEARIAFIPDAGHQLANESPALRDEMLRWLDEQLRAGAPPTP